MTAMPRKCKRPGCGTTVTGMNLFCGTDYYRLPGGMREKLWTTLYGGSSHVKACLKYLADLEQK